MKIKTSIAAVCAAMAIGAAGQANATTYDISADLVLAGVHISTLTPGAYDDVSGLGNWAVHIDGTTAGFGISDLTQTFSMDAATGTGVMDTGTCTGDATTCAVMGAGLAGAWSSDTVPVTAGSEVWTLASTPVGPAPINVTLTPAVPVPAAAWLFGSGLAGLAGVSRRRRAAA